MNIRPLHLVLTLILSASIPAFADDTAKKLHDSAMQDTGNQERQVTNLCKAADLDAKNKQYRNDCNDAKGAMISADKDSWKTAQDAADASPKNVAKAKRYAGYVSIFSPDLHRQAQELIAKLSEGDKPQAPPPLQPVKDQSGAVLAQAHDAFEKGNLQAAVDAAKAVTDPNLVPLATGIVRNVESYHQAVNEGSRHEQAKEYALAKSSYQEAQRINAHVSSDDLSAKIARMGTEVASAQAPPPPQPPSAPKTTTVDQPKVVAKGSDVPKPPQPSPDEKKKHLLDEASKAMSRKDLDAAGRMYKQVIDIDASNQEANRGLADIKVALSRDPVLLEKTLREAITAFYSSQFDDAENRLNRYLGADGGKKKGAAYFYLGATEATLAVIDTKSKRATHQKEAQDDFKQARLAGYQPVEKYVSTRILDVWKSPGL